MNCADVLPVLRDYVDRELDELRAVQVARHLEDCPACAGRVQSELDLKRAIRSKVHVLSM